MLYGDFRLVAICLMTSLTFCFFSPVVVSNAGITLYSPKTCYFRDFSPFPNFFPPISFLKEGVAVFENHLKSLILQNCHSIFKYLKKMAIKYQQIEWYEN